MQQGTTAAALQLPSTATTTPMLHRSPELGTTAVRLRTRAKLRTPAALQMPAVQDMLADLRTLAVKRLAPTAGRPQVFGIAATQRQGASSC